MEPRDFDAFAGRVRDSFRDEDHPAPMKPLEESRVKSVQRMLGALGRADLDAFLAETHPDVEMEIHVPPQFPWTLRARGQQELRSLVEHNFATVTDQNPQVLNVVAQGNLLVLMGRERGRLRESGAAYDVHFVYEFTFRDDKVSYVRELAALSRD
jgi:hypothetical protein